MKAKSGVTTIALLLTAFVGCSRHAHDELQDDIRSRWPGAERAALPVESPKLRLLYLGPPDVLPRLRVLLADSSGRRVVPGSQFSTMTPDGVSSRPQVRGIPLSASGHFVTKVAILSASNSADTIVSLDIEETVRPVHDYLLLIGIMNLRPLGQPGRTVPYAPLPPGISHPADSLFLSWSEFVRR